MHPQGSLAPEDLKDFQGTINDIEKNHLENYNDVYNTCLKKEYGSGEKCRKLAEVFYARELASKEFIDGILGPDENDVEFTGKLDPRVFEGSFITEGDSKEEDL